MTVTTRMLKYHGKDATVTNFTVDTTDDYGDKTFTESTSTAKVIIIRQPADIAPAVQDIEGQDIRMEAEIYLDDDVDVYDGEGTSYPSEITVDGEDYEVQAVDPQGLGVTRVLAKRV